MHKAVDYTVIEDENSRGRLTKGSMSIPRLYQGVLYTLAVPGSAVYLSCTRECCIPRLYQGVLCT